MQEESVDLHWLSVSEFLSGLNIDNWPLKCLTEAAFTASETSVSI